MGRYPPSSCGRLQGGQRARVLAIEAGASGSQRALLGSGRLLALWKANRQLAYHWRKPTREEHNKTRVWAEARTWPSKGARLVPVLGAIWLVGSRRTRRRPVSRLWHWL